MLSSLIPDLCSWNDSLVSETWCHDNYRRLTHYIFIYITKLNEIFIKSSNRFQPTNLILMAINGLLSYEFLGNFLLLTLILPTFIFSDSNHEIQLRNISRRALSATPQNIIQQYLQPHNRVRAQLGLKPLQMEWETGKLRQFVGNQRRKDCALVHAKSNYGDEHLLGQRKKLEAIRRSCGMG